MLWKTTYINCAIPNSLKDCLYKHFEKQRNSAIHLHKCFDYGAVVNEVSSLPFTKSPAALLWPQIFIQSSDFNAFQRIILPFSQKFPPQCSCGSKFSSRTNLHFKLIKKFCMFTNNGGFDINICCWSFVYIHGTSVKISLQRFDLVTSNSGCIRFKFQPL